MKPTRLEPGRAGGGGAEALVYVFKLFTCFADHTRSWRESGRGDGQEGEFINLVIPIKCISCLFAIVEKKRCSHLIWLLRYSNVMDIHKANANGNAMQWV